MIDMSQLRNNRPNIRNDNGFWDSETQTVNYGSESVKYLEHKI